MNKIILARLVLAASLCVAFANPVAAQAPCERTESAAFLTAASDIQSGCGYLLESQPANYVLAASNFRMALTKEPGNAVAHFLLGVSLAGYGETAQARTALAQAKQYDPQIMMKAEALFERSPALRTLAQAALAEPGAPAAPRPSATDVPPPGKAPEKAPAADPAPNAAFAVGAAVEIEYRNGEWFPGVVTSVDPGVCPYYNVRADVYGNGRPSTLGYGCKTVRAPTGIATPVAACGGSNPNCKPKSPPPLGRYTCDVTRWDVADKRVKFDYKGYFELLAGGRYRWLDDGGTGTYAYDAKTHAVSWRTGPLRAQGGTAVYGLDGKTPEITITFATDYTRRTGNEPVRWQCAR
jgi:hypothetical protein